MKILVGVLLFLGLLVGGCFAWGQAYGRRETPAILATYEAFYAAVVQGDSEAAYVRFSPSFRSENSLESFKQQFKPSFYASPSFKVDHRVAVSAAPPWGRAYVVPQGYDGTNGGLVFTLLKEGDAWYMHGVHPWQR